MQSHCQCSKSSILVGSILKNIFFYSNLRNEGIFQGDFLKDNMVKLKVYDVKQIM